MFTAVGGAALAPDRVDQLVGADDLAAVQRQNGQDRLAPQAMYRPRLAADHDVDWPQKTYLHDIPRLHRKVPTGHGFGASLVQCGPQITQN